MATYKGYLILRDYVNKVDCRYDAYKNDKLTFVATTKELLYDEIDKQVKKDEVLKGIEEVAQGRSYTPNEGYGATVLDLNKAKLKRQKPVRRVRATLDDGNKLTVEWDGDVD